MQFKNHPDYDKWIDRWTRCRDAVAGQDEVRAKKEGYLPKPSKYWTNDEYDNYLKHADYFNASGRTLDLYTGLIFKRPPVIVNPPRMDGFVEDCTMGGESLVQFARRCTREVITVGRAGVMVDYPDGSTAGMTQEEVEALNLRPRFAFYPAESVENWRQEWRVNRYVITYIQLREAEKRRRILLLDETGVYRVQVWIEGEKGDWVMESEVVPIMNGAPLRYIPFAMLDPTDASMSVDAPPILDLVNMNLSHYRTMADLELGRQKTALPTFTATGIPEDQQGEIRLGAGNALVSQNPDAKFGMLEFTGQGLGALEKADADKRLMMSKLGAESLSEGSGREESGEAQQIKKAGEDSVLATLANTVSETLTWCMEVARDWYGLAETEEVSIQLNTRFFQKTANPQELAVLVGQVQAGALSSRRLWAYLQERDIMPHDVSFEQVREEVDMDDQAVLASVGMGRPDVEDSDQDRR